MSSDSHVTREGHQALSYRPDIDGLRGVAVLLVLVFHFNLFDLGKAGFIGVDVFFVISGYLISRIIWGEIDRGTFRLPRFYARRVRRLAPPLIATQCVVFAAACVIMMPSEMSDLAQEGIASQLYVSNFFYWRTLDYFGFQAASSVFLHTWSLAVEEQFYLLYPAFMLLIHKIAPRHRYPAIIAIAVISFALNMMLVDAKPELTFYLLPTRAWELLAGALLAAGEKTVVLGQRSRALIGLAGASCIGLALFLYSPGTSFPGAFALLPVIGGACLILAGRAPGATATALSWRPLNLTGRISYSLYLVHWPIKVFLPLVVLDVSHAWRWFGFGLSFALATIFYVCVEHPIRRGSMLSSPRATLAAYAAATAGVVLLFGYVLSSGGLPGRFDRRTLAIASAVNDADTRTRDCKLGIAQTQPACTLGAAGAPRSWLIVGDSHAQALSGAIDLWLRSRGESGLLVYAPGCVPLRGFGGPHCDHFATAIRKLSLSPETRRILLVSTWRQLIESNLVDANNNSLGPAEARAAFLRGLHMLLDEARADGREIFIWMPLPAAKKSIPLALARSEALGLDWDIAATARKHRSEYRFFYDAVRQSRSRLGGVVDAAAVLCASGKCRTVAGGRPIYHDNGHPAASQSRYFAAILRDQLAAVPPIASPSGSASRPRAALTAQ